MKRQQQASNRILRGADELSIEGRLGGMHVQAGPGSGKSRFIGRDVVYRDILSGIPGLVIDPSGGLVDNVLDKLLMLSERAPPEVSQRLWDRVLYIDMSGNAYGHCYPLPLLYRRDNETLDDIAMRPLEAMRKIDPAMSNAAIEGFNAFKRIGRLCLAILAALGLPFSEVFSLLREPEKWEERFEEAVRRYPEAQEAVNFFRGEYKQWRKKPDLLEKRIGSFLSKMDLYQLHPIEKAIYASSGPGIDWQWVEAQGITVLCDLRHVESPERKRWAMSWLYEQFINFVKWRGQGRHKNIAFTCDEVTQLTSFDQVGNEIWAETFNEVLAVIGRSHRLLTCLIHQSSHQLTESLRKTLMACANQVIGATGDQRAAVQLAEELVRLDPFRVKRYVPRYGREGEVIDWQPEYWTLNEQRQLASGLFATRPGNFLVRYSAREGDLTAQLRPMTIAHLDPGRYPNDVHMARLRALLSQKSGRPVQEVLAEMDQLHRQWQTSMSLANSTTGQQQPSNVANGSGKLTSNDRQKSNLPTTEQPDGEGVIYESAP